MGACFSCKIIKLSLASPKENKNQRIATVLVTSEESEVACVGQKKLLRKIHVFTYVDGSVCVSANAN
jgi:hypothetical protein